MIITLNIESNVNKNKVVGNCCVEQLLTQLVKKYTGVNMDEIDIVFDDGQVLYSGQRVSGKVLCHSTKSCDMKSIFFLLLENICIWLSRTELMQF